MAPDDGWCDLPDRRAARVPTGSKAGGRAAPLVRRRVGQVGPNRVKLM
jgi:hypothetical protein